MGIFPGLFANMNRQSHRIHPEQHDSKQFHSVFAESNDSEQIPDPTNRITVAPQNAPHPLIEETEREEVASTIIAKAIENGYRFDIWKSCLGERSCLRR